MKRMAEKIERMFAASAFAEEGEFKTAAAILKAEPIEAKKTGVCATKRPVMPLRNAQYES
jgi:hypothetical protein